MNIGRLGGMRSQESEELKILRRKVEELERDLFASRKRTDQLEAALDESVHWIEFWGTHPNEEVFRTDLDDLAAWVATRSVRQASKGSVS